MDPGLAVSSIISAAWKVGCGAFLTVAVACNERPVRSIPVVQLRQRLQSGGKPGVPAAGANCRGGSNWAYLLDQTDDQGERKLDTVA